MSETIGCVNTNSTCTKWWPCAKRAVPTETVRNRTRCRSRWNFANRKGLTSRSRTTRIVRIFFFFLCFSDSVCHVLLLFVHLKKTKWRYKRVTLPQFRCEYNPVPHAATASCMIRKWTAQPCKEHELFERLSGCKILTSYVIVRTRRHCFAKLTSW